MQIHPSLSSSFLCPHLCTTEMGYKNSSTVPNISAANIVEPDGLLLTGKQEPHCRGSAKHAFLTNARKMLWYFRWHSVCSREAFMESTLDRWYCLLPQNSFLFFPNPILFLFILCRHHTTEDKTFYIKKSRSISSLPTCDQPVCWSTGRPNPGSLSAPRSCSDDSKARPQTNHCWEEGNWDPRSNSGSGS